ncbi:HAD-IA family hydrolase [Ectothiorhodospiraceae bacterium WFHF3C12]|nr:HAD-IA family hydrolase [Ectothiorhodospiraceae bacterium WFHF3C12]
MLQPPAAEAVILDLDGTLLDTAPDLIGAVNDLRRAEGLAPVTREHLMPVVSHGSAALIRRGFDMDPRAPAFEPLRQRLLDIYAHRISRETRPFPGMMELVESLERRGIPWGVVTNKPGWLTRPLLRDLGLMPRLSCLVTGDCLPERKPSPQPILSGCEQLGLHPGQCLAIGDAERDVQASHRAGTASLVALYGYINGEDQVRRWGAEGLIDHPMQALRWVATRGGAASQRRRRSPADAHTA